MVPEQVKLFVGLDMPQGQVKHLPRVASQAGAVGLDFAVDRNPQVILGYCHELVIDKASQLDDGVLLPEVDRAERDVIRSCWVIRDAAGLDKPVDGRELTQFHDIQRLRCCFGGRDDHRCNSCRDDHDQHANSVADKLLGQGHSILLSSVEMENYEDTMSIYLL